MPTNDLSRRQFGAGGVAVASLAGGSNRESDGGDGSEQTDDGSMSDGSMSDGSSIDGSGTELMRTGTSTDG